MSRRGTSLVGVLLLAALMGFVSLRVLDYSSQARLQVARVRYEVEAEAMARSGLRYAEAMIAHRRWTGATRFQSPPLGQGERFSVMARPTGGGWVVVSTGEVGSVKRTLKETI